MLKLLTSVALIYSVFGEKTVRLQGSLVTDGESSTSNILISLNNNQFQTYSKADGTFTIYNVPSGIYLLEAYSIEHMFPFFKIKVVAENETISVIEYKYLGATKIPKPHPIVIQAIFPTPYFAKREGFSIIRLITGNPMMVLMLFTFGIMMFYPKMMQDLNSNDAIKGIDKHMDADDPMKPWKKLMGMDTSTEDDD